MFNQFKFVFLTFALFAYSTTASAETLYGCCGGGYPFLGFTGVLDVPCEKINVDGKEKAICFGGIKLPQKLEKMIESNLPDKYFLYGFGDYSSIAACLVYKKKNEVFCAGQIGGVKGLVDINVSTAAQQSLLSAEMIQTGGFYNDGICAFNRNSVYPKCVKIVESGHLDTVAIGVPKDGVFKIDFDSVVTNYEAEMARLLNSKHASLTRSCSTPGYNFTWPSSINGISCRYANPKSVYDHKSAITTLEATNIGNYSLGKGRNFNVITSFADERLVCATDSNNETSCWANSSQGVGDEILYYTTWDKKTAYTSVEVTNAHEFDLSILDKSSKKIFFERISGVAPLKLTQYLCELSDKQKTNTEVSCYQLSIENKSNGVLTSLIPVKIEKILSTYF